MNWRKPNTGPQTIEPALAWELVREDIPAAPAQALVLAAAGERVAQLRQQHIVGGRKMLRLVYAVALALVLALCGGTVFWFGGRERQTAWASAEGYVLHYEVYDRAVKERPWKSKLPNEAAFAQAVRDWAQHNRIRFSDSGWIDAPRFIGLGPRSASGSWPEDMFNNGYSVTLIGISEAERDALITRLEPLPGVAPPAISGYTQYYVLAGIPNPLLPSQAIINGKTYDFPQDFTLEEANALQWLFMHGRDYTRYYAFKEITSGPKPRASRLELGDVFKAELNDHGDLVLTTLVQVWKEGRILRNEPQVQEHLGPHGDRGWSVSMSRALPEPGFDPMQALAAVFDRQTRDGSDSEYSINTGLTYQFFTPERMLAPGAPKYTAEEAARATVLAAKLDQALIAFQAAHPEYWDKRIHRYRITYKCYEFGAMPMRYLIFVSDSDGQLAKQIQHLLSGIAGLPEVQVVHRDLEAERKALLQQYPPTTDESGAPLPLPAPNPAQWHACQGYKLRCRMLERLYEGESIGEETAAERAFTHAAAQWAAECNLPVNPQPAPAAAKQPGSASGLGVQLPVPALYMGGPGWSGEFNGYTEACFTLYLATADAALPASLTAALTALPGVAPPESTACTFYVHDAHPEQPLTGGDLLVDGQRYHFPDDFAWEEARGLSASATMWRGVHYTAFFTLVEPERNRIKFPDVARLELQPGGSLKLTTYKAEWPAGRKLRSRHQAVYGPTVELPQGVAERGFDPLPELGKRLQPGTGKTSAGRCYTLYYYISPQEQWLSEYVAGKSGANVVRRQVVYAELDRRLTELLDAHPEYKDSPASMARVYWHEFPFSGLALGADVIVYSDDEALVKEVQRVLSGVRGLPRPVQEQEQLSSAQVTFRVH